MNSSWQDSISSLPTTADTPSTQTPEEKMGLAWLVVAALVTVAVWQVPYGNYIAYPFTILATWFHEMGHGLTALLAGGRFESLSIYPDGSGVAAYTAPADMFLWGRLRGALVAAGGLMGPPIAGAIFILASRRFQTARTGLILLSCLMLLSVLLWIRTLFGFTSIALLALIIMAVALRAPRWVQGFAMQLLGVQACISTFHQFDYLFTASAVIGGRAMLSDSGQIAQNLLLPYWFWGGLIAITSILLMIGSLYVRYRPERSSSKL